MQRTGIRQRHIAGEGETTSTLATARRASGARQAAGLTPADIDLVIVATSTPDYTFPAVATQVQAALGMHAWRGLRPAGGLLRLRLRGRRRPTSSCVSGSHKRALVIGAETFSRLLDWRTARPACCSATAPGRSCWRRVEGDGARSRDRGVLTSHLRSDGRHREKLYVDGGPSTTQTVGHLRMEGREVFRHAVGMVTDVDRRTAFARRGHRAPTTSTGSCRIRPTAASSTPPPTSSASRARRWS